MPQLTTKLPPIPFGGCSDAVLLYCPNSDTYRVIVGNATSSTVLKTTAPYGHSNYLYTGCSVANYDGSSFILQNGVWTAESRQDYIFYDIDDAPEASSLAAIPISASFDLRLDTHNTPYEEQGNLLLCNLSYIDLHHQNLTVMDSVLSGERITTPILLEIYGLLPVVIVLLVGYLSIRKCIAFLADRLRGA